MISERDKITLGRPQDPGPDHNRLHASNMVKVNNGWWDVCPQVNHLLMLNVDGHITEYKENLNKKIGFVRFIGS